MKIFWWILWIILTLYIRIWIINNSFKNKKYKLNFSVIIFLLSLLLVALLYFYKDILGLIWLENLYFSWNISVSSIILFIFYCVSFLIFVSLVLWNIKKNRNLDYIIVAILLFIWIGLWWVISGINTMIMYYLISCYAEEILKFSIWENVLIRQEKQWNNNINLFSNDLILFSVIAWLGFSVVENVFYLIVLAIWDNWSILTTIWRSIFATLLHIVATWLIAFFIVKKDKHKFKYRSKCLIWIISWFCLHWLYNLSLAYGYKILTIIILIICYFILTYLLFNSDLIYKQEE